MLCYSLSSLLIRYLFQWLLYNNNKTADVRQRGLRKTTQKRGKLGVIQEEEFTRLLNTKKVRQPKIGSVRNDKINYDKD